MADPTLHPLKTWPGFFEAILSGEKPFEIRRNDRDYQAGDVLELHETADLDPLAFTGRTLRRRVTYVLLGPKFGLSEGFAAMGLAPLETNAVRDVLAERRRQVEIEGWTPEHDDQHVAGGMAEAAACYATSARWWQMRWNPASVPDRMPWPWARRWWKPKGPREDLVRAAALILAEIERLDRAADREGPANVG